MNSPNSEHTENNHFEIFIHIILIVLYLIWYGMIVVRFGELVGAVGFLEFCIFSAESMLDAECPMPYIFLLYGLATRNNHPFHPVFMAIYNRLTMYSILHIFAAHFFFNRTGFYCPRFM